MNDSMTVSVREASRLLGVGIGSVYEAVRTCRLPALKVGRKPRLRIPRNAIEHLLRHPEEWSKGTRG
jgi:excisionase family DNA binding protein